MVLSTPSLQYCMDNAAMIAYVGRMRLESGLVSPLDLSADPGLAISEVEDASPHIPSGNTA